jgi:hypothetical protein
MVWYVGLAVIGVVLIVALISVAVRRSKGGRGMTGRRG